MDDLERALTAIRRHNWKVVLLKPGTKRIQGTWKNTSEEEVIRNHLFLGGGIGIDAYESHVVVLDVDNPTLAIKACLDIFPLPPPTVTSPSGGQHIYVALPSGLRPEDLPAKMIVDGQLMGEIIRGPHQQTVMPPTPYPGNSKRNVPAGGEYTWLYDVSLGVPVLPREWVDYFTGSGEESGSFAFLGEGYFGIPDHVLKDVTDDWDGPCPATIVAYALARLRRARAYRGGAKGQCPQCAADGHDKHHDNAYVSSSGRWGCAYAPRDPVHRRAIGIAIGVVSERHREQSTRGELEKVQPGERERIR